MRVLNWILGLLLAAAPAVAAAELTPAQWREDVDALAEHLTERHRDPYHSVDRAELEAAMAELRESVDEAPAESIVLGMARLTTMIGDGHTRFTLPVNHDHLGLRLAHRVDPPPAPGVPRLASLPLRLRFLGDELCVVAATGEHRGLLGTVVTAIEGRPVAEAIAAVEPWAPADTPSMKRLMSARNLSIPALLRAGGIIHPPAKPADRRDTVTLSLMRGEEMHEVEIPPLAYDATAEWHELWGTEPEALWLRERSSWFWLEWLPEPRALYIQLNRVEDIPGGETLGQFGRRIREALRAHDPAKVVLDLRHNHGGDGTLGRAIVLPLVRWEASAQSGRLYALVGPETFSAAVILLDKLEQWTQLSQVGEEPGSGPSAYSDSDRDLLPNSGLAVRVSTALHIGWTGGEGRTRYEVDLPAAPSLAAVTAGRDPVLEAALAHQAGADLTAQIIRGYDRGGINTSLLILYRHRSDPLTAAQSTEGPMNALARHVWKSGKVRFAASLYRFNWESYPGSVEAYRGEAAARLEMGDLDAAREAIDQALTLAPEDPEVMALAERIGAVE